MLNDEERESKIISQVPPTTTATRSVSDATVSEEIDIDGSNVTVTVSSDFNQEDHPDSSIISHQGRKETEIEKEREPINEKDDNNKIRICIWASNSMDGQKNIWIQIVKHLNPKKFK